MFKNAGSTGTEAVDGSRTRVSSLGSWGNAVIRPPHRLSVEYAPVVISSSNLQPTCNLKPKDPLLGRRHSVVRSFQVTRNNEPFIYTDFARHGGSCIRSFRIYALGCLAPLLGPDYLRSCAGSDLASHTMGWVSCVAHRLGRQIVRKTVWEIVICPPCR